MTTQSATIVPVALAGNGMRWLQLVIGVMGMVMIANYQ